MATDHRGCLKQLNHRTLDDIIEKLRIVVDADADKESKVEAVKSALSEEMASQKGESLFPGGGGGDGGDDGDDDDQDDSGDDEPEDGDDEGGTSDDGSCNINIRLPSGEMVHVVVELSDEVKTLKALVRDKKGIPRREQRLAFAGVQMEDDKALSAYNVFDGATVDLLMSIAGGVFTTKKHITKEAQVKAMAKKYSSLAKASVVKNMDADPSEVERQPVPPPLQQMMAPITGRMRDLEAESRNNEVVLQPILERLADNHLQSLKSLLESTKTASRPEVKMEQIAYQLAPDLQTIDDYINHLYKMKADALVFFIELYTKEYHLEKTGMLSFDHGKLLGEVLGAINYRKGLRRMASASAADAVAADPAPEGGCNIS
jgi:hypothetical protein